MPSKWSIPPVYRTLLRVQQLNQRLKIAALRDKLERADKLLSMHVKQAQQQTSKRQKPNG